MTTEATAALLADLTDDGDTVELSDGRTIRLRIVPDDTRPFDDTDFYGAVAWVEWDRTTGHAIRPDGFDGNAEKMHTQQNGDAFWWQPPADGPKRGTPEFAELRRHVNDLVSFGYVGMVLEVLDGDDAYRRPIVVAIASLWGVEPFADRDYRREVVLELADELGIHVHEYGPFEVCRLSGEPFRRCTYPGCRIVSLDGDEGDEDDE